MGRDEARIDNLAEDGSTPERDRGIKQLQSTRLVALARSDSGVLQERTEARKVELLGGEDE